MKRVSVYLLLLVLCMALVACNADEADEVSGIGEADEASIASNDCSYGAPSEANAELNMPVAAEIETIAPKTDADYPDVEKIAGLSAGMGLFRFVQRWTGSGQYDMAGFIFDYATAVIDVYEIGAGDEPIDSLEMNIWDHWAWGEYSFIDVNFDGVKDIVINTDYRGNQAMNVYVCFAWNEKLSKFEPIPFPEWGFVSVDGKRQLLLTAWRNWAASHGWAIYEYIDGALTETHRCERTYLESDDDGNEIVHLVKEQRIDGAWQRVFDDHVTEEILDSELFYDDFWRLGSPDWIGVWEANEAEEMYLDILRGDGEFFYCYPYWKAEHAQTHWIDSRFPSIGDEDACGFTTFHDFWCFDTDEYTGRIDHFTVLDMDGDGAPVVVLDLFPGDYKLVLRYENRTVCGYLFPNRGMMGLTKDGTFEGASGVGHQVMYQMGFASGVYESIELCRVDTDREWGSNDYAIVYRMHGEEVTEDVYYAFKEEQQQKEKAVWHVFSEDSISVDFMAVWNDVE